MSSDPAKDFAIRVRDVSKRYVMFERSEDRFKQMVVPRLQRLVGRPPRRYFRDFAALNGVSLEVGRGETVGIIGRNGSGKSTLLQIICGTLQPTSGTVEVNGRIAALLELGAGFNPEFTGRENVFLNASILGVPRKEMEWRFDDIARFADIGSFMDQPVKTYSSGMYVRLAFATAINVDPDILIVDEALSVGDEAFQRKCFARIEDIKDKGGTILFVSHGAQTIVQLCSRAILIDGGEKLLTGNPKTVVTQYQRLVNASPDAATQIRSAIVGIRDGTTGHQSAHESLETVGGAGAVSAGSHLPSVSKESVSKTKSVLPEAANYEDSFDAQFVSKSVLNFEQRGADIENVRLETQSGKQVNRISRGRTYRIAFEVTFSEAFLGVGFGATVRNVSGLALAGCMTNKLSSYEIKDVEVGKRFSVNFDVSMIFLPSTYFVSVAVFGRTETDNCIAHRISDALIFEIMPEVDLIATGLVDAGFRPDVRHVSIGS